ncbi:MAG: hypothetical protein H5T34_05255 [Candidatus Methanomethyliales bacterium]|nr:hypothetical protein [Candidatus Methanomethylicales archaeon]
MMRGILRGLGAYPGFNLEAGLGLRAVLDYGLVQIWVLLGGRSSRGIIDNPGENICKMFSNVKSEIKYKNKTKVNAKNKAKTKRFKSLWGDPFWL